MMNQQNAAALMAYLQRAAQIIPTVGAEWEIIRGALGVIERVAAGEITLEAKAPQMSNGKATREGFEARP